MKYYAFYELYPFGHYAEEANAALVASSNIPGTNPNDFMHRTNYAEPPVRNNPKAVEAQLDILAEQMGAKRG